MVKLGKQQQNNKQQTIERTNTMSVPITIENANITGEGGSITNATIKGDATIPPASVGVPTHPIALPGDPWWGTDLLPSHPIALPPASDNPDVFFVLTFCPNPPPPHWEWIAYLPGDPPERPSPQPPSPPDMIPSEPKPPPADGGWGWYPEYGWVYYPGPGGAGPKKRK